MPFGEQETIPAADGGTVSCVLCTGAGGAGTEPSQRPAGGRAQAHGGQPLTTPGAKHEGVAPFHFFVFQLLKLSRVA